VAGQRKARRNAGRRILVLAAAAFSLMLGATPAAAARPGSLDRGFSKDGLATERLIQGKSGSVPGLVVQPDGRAVLAAGDRIVRYRRNGRRDRSFSVRHAPVLDLAEGPDGDLIRLAKGEIERLLPDGEPDPSFGDAGDGRVSVPGLQLLAVAVDSAERIVLVGRDPEAHRLVVARLLPDGKPDPGFGTLGTVRTAASAATPANLDVARAVAVAPDGSILVGGSAGQAEECPVGALHCWGPYLDAVVLRYLLDGRLDQGFGKGGIFWGDDSWGSARSVVARPRGGVLFIPGGPTGAVEPGGGPHVTAVALTVSGEAELSFGDVGSAYSFERLWRALASPNASQLVVDAAGRTLICGEMEGSHRGLFLLAMLWRNGEPARTFGRNGLVVTRISREAGGRSGAEALALAPRHKVYVAGQAGGKLFLARYRF